MLIYGSNATSTSFGMNGLNAVIHCGIDVNSKIQPRPAHTKVFSPTIRLTNPMGSDHVAHGVVRIGHGPTTSVSHAVVALSS